MNDWISVKDRLPDTETECLLAQRDGTAIKTYPKLAEWDGFEWVDIDGEEVENVECWMKAPEFTG